MDLNRRPLDDSFESRQPMVPPLTSRALENDPSPQGADRRASQLLIVHGLTAPSPALACPPYIWRNRAYMQARQSNLARLPSTVRLARGFLTPASTGRCRTKPRVSPGRDRTLDLRI